MEDIQQVNRKFIRAIPIFIGGVAGVMMSHHWVLACGMIYIIAAFTQEWLIERGYYR